MAAAGSFSGPLVLLSPSFSREDEFKMLAVLDRIGRVPGVGQLAWALAMKAMPRSMKDSVPPGRRDALIAVMASNSPGFCRRLVREYFEYIDRHGSVVARLCESGVQACVVFGEHDEVGLTDDERRGLEACPSVTLETVADAGHMMLTQQPERTAELIAAAVSVRR